MILALTRGNIVRSANIQKELLKGSDDRKSFQNKNIVKKEKNSEIYTERYTV